jgi:hypothetical protein
MGTHLQAGAPDGVATDIYYSNNVDGDFTVPISFTVPTGYYSYRPTVAVDSEDSVHVVFTRRKYQTARSSDDDIYYVNNRKGAFDAPLILVDGGPSWHRPMMPMICLDSSDTVHIAFLGRRSPRLYYTNDSGGTFRTPTYVSADLYRVEAYTMVLDEQGWPHFAMTAKEDSLFDEAEIFYAGATSDPAMAPSFSTAVNVSNWPRNLGGFWPALAVDGTGAAHIVFRDPFGSPSKGEGGAWYVNNVRGSFSPPVQIKAGISYGHWLNSDDEGYLHLVSKGGPTSLYYLNDRGGLDPDDYHFVTSDVGFFAPRYFAVGSSSHLHITYQSDSDYEIMYVHGTYAEANTPPTVSGLPDQMLSINSSVQDAIDLWAHTDDLEDAEADLTFGIGNAPSPKAGVSIDDNRYVDINPQAGWTGTTEVEIEVEDSGGLTDTDTFQLTVSGGVVYLPLVMRR